MLELIPSQDVTLSADGGSEVTKNEADMEETGRSEAVRMLEEAAAESTTSWSRSAEPAVAITLAAG